MDKPEHVSEVEDVASQAEDQPVAKRHKAEPPKFYAVKIGRVPGVYKTWAEARQQIRDLDEYQMRVFDFAAEASDYLGICEQPAEWVATFCKPYTFRADRPETHSKRGVFVGTVISRQDVDRLLKILVCFSDNVDVYKIGVHFILFFGAVMSHTDSLEDELEGIDSIIGLDQPQVSSLRNWASGQNMEKMKHAVKQFNGDHLPWGVYAYGYDDNDRVVNVYPVN